MSSQFHSVKYEIDVSAKSILGHIGLRHSFFLPIVIICTLVSQTILEVEYESIHYNIWKIKQALTVQSNYVSKESNLFKRKVANKAMFEMFDCIIIFIKNWIIEWIMQFKTFYWLNHYGTKANIHNLQNMVSVHVSLNLKLRISLKLKGS